MIVAGILNLAVTTLPTPIIDPSRQWPFGATLHSMVTVSSSVVLGAVLVRAGGSRALLVYVAYVLLGILVSLPGIMVFCDRSGGLDGSCRVPLFYIAAGRAPEWIGVAAGAVLSRWVGSKEPGANATLRGAGALSFTLFVLTIPFGFLSYTGAFNDVLTSALLFMIVEVAAGMVGGVVLARARFGSVLLVALVILGPALAFATPLLRPGGAAGEAPDFTLARWVSVLAPAAGAVALLLARGFARRRAEGTFF